MKKLFNLLFLAFVHFAFSQNINFTDANFKSFLLESNSTNGFVRDLNNNSIKLDQNNDGEIQISEAENVSLISFNGRFSDFSYTVFYFWGHYDFVNEPIKKDIYSLEGISYFKNLRILDCAYAKISTLDFTNLNKLEQLICKKNQITSFTNFQFVKSLIALDCSYNLLEILDLSQASINLNRNEVLLKYNDNDLHSLNLQNGKITAWCCLCSCDQAYCPFSNDINCIFSTCCRIPNFDNYPNLTDLKVNCFDKQWYPSFAVDNCDVQSTEEIANLNDKIKVSQNNSNGILTIMSPLKIDSYTILDMSGRVLKSEKTDNKNIDISYFNKGVYIIKVETKEGIANLKFIKN